MRSPNIASQTYLLLALSPGDDTLDDFARGWR